MSNKIYLEEADYGKIIEAIKASTANKKCLKKEVKYEFANYSDEKAMLYFTPKAYIKMAELVSSFSTEVQWHGLTHRISSNEFCVDDIIVPPHKVSAATVVSDDKEYCEWINGLPDDTFNAMRFHGHSHVNMATNPSAVDMDYRHDLVTQLPRGDEETDSYYIFFIWNKNHCHDAEIFDLKENMHYDCKDITIDVCDQSGENPWVLSAFVDHAKSVAVTATYPTYKTQSSGYRRPAWEDDDLDYDSYHSYSSSATGKGSSFPSTKKTSTPVKTQTTAKTPVTTVKKDAKGKTLSWMEYSMKYPFNGYSDYLEYVGSLDIH